MRKEYKLKPGSRNHRAYMRGYRDGQNKQVNDQYQDADFTLPDQSSVSLGFYVGVSLGAVGTALIWFLTSLIG